MREGGDVNNGPIAATTSSSILFSFFSFLLLGVVCANDINLYSEDGGALPSCGWSFYLMLLRIGDSTGRLARRVASVRLAVSVSLVVHGERYGASWHDRQCHRHVTRYVARQVMRRRDVTARIVGRRWRRRFTTHSLLLLLMLRSVTLGRWWWGYSTTSPSTTTGRYHHRIILVQIVIISTLAFKKIRCSNDSIDI